MTFLAGERSPVWHLAFAVPLTPASAPVTPPASSPPSGTQEEFALTKVTVRDGETVERAIKRFKRKVEQAGILKEVRKREHYLKPSVKAKLKARAAEARARKREKRLQQSTGI